MSIPFSSVTTLALLSQVATARPHTTVIPFAHSPAPTQSALTTMHIIESGQQSLEYRQETIDLAKQTLEGLKPLETFPFDILQIEEADAGSSLSEQDKAYLTNGDVGKVIPEAESYENHARAFLKAQGGLRYVLGLIADGNTTPILLEASETLAGYANQHLDYLVSDALDEHLEDLYPEEQYEVKQILEGRVSYYADAFHGRTTANGEKFNMYAMTAAHKTLPFGTFVRVTNLNNNKVVVVRINDRGPYTREKDGRVRELDLSKAAADVVESTGVFEGRIEVLSGKIILRSDLRASASASLNALRLRVATVAQFSELQETRNLDAAYSELRHMLQSATQAPMLDGR